MPIEMIEEYMTSDCLLDSFDGEDIQTVREARKFLEFHPYGHIVSRTWSDGKFVEWFEEAAKNQKPIQYILWGECEAAREALAV